VKSKIVKEMVLITYKKMISDQKSAKIICLFDQKFDFIYKFKRHVASIFNEKNNDELNN
jgi:hypothetical protein